MPAPELFNLFAVPFAISRYADPAALNAALRNYILAREQSGDATNPRPLTYRNDALFESHFDLFREPDPAIQELKRFCWDQLLAIIGKLNGYDLQTLHRLQIYNDCWFHVTRRGGYFGLHNHANASWSGVYCVDPGKSDPDKTMSGALCFVNPTIMYAMHMDAGINSMRLPYGSHVAHFRLDPGQLVIFPSWVMHDVKPYEGDGERITIAFNCWFTLPDAVDQSSGSAHAS